MGEGPAHDGRVILGLVVLASIRNKQHPFVASTPAPDSRFEFLSWLLSMMDYDVEV